MYRKGAKTVQGRVGNQRETMTVIGAVNAAGKALPPHVILPGKTPISLRAYDTEKALENTRISVSDSGWVKEVCIIQPVCKSTFYNIFLINYYVSNCTCNLVE